MNANALESEVSKKSGNGPIRTSPKPRISVELVVDAISSNGMRKEKIIIATATNASRIIASPVVAR